MLQHVTDPETAAKAPISPVLEPATILAVIPALNEARHIETCIRSLMAGSPSLRDVPLMVVDGGSSDKTVEIVEGLKVEFPNLSVIHNPKRLQSAAINLAAETQATSKTRILVRCDAHSVYPENFILDVAQSLVSVGAASLVIPMDAVGQTCFEKANAWIVNTLLGSGGALHRSGKASCWVDHGHHAGFDLQWYQRLRGYDETFSHNEDVEYDLRVTKAGGRIYLDSEIRIKYIPRGDVRRLWIQYAGYGRGRAQNARIHGAKLKLRHTAPIAALIGSIGGLLASAVYGPAIIIPLGYLVILTAASLVVTIRHKSLCGLLAGLAAGTMHMGWAFGYIREAMHLRR